jgi:stage II sporulation protein D
MLSKLEIRPSRSGLIVVVPTDLESYVAGVLAGEAAILRSLAARQAMAILARTWAMRWRGRHGAEGFDFCSLTHCQVFRAPDVGAVREPPLQQAVRETQGEILQFNGELVDPYFSADCGGLTEAAGNVWPDRARAYLVSIHDPYCAGSEHASWQRALPLEEAEKILRTDMHVPLRGPLTNVTIAKIDSSGRAQILLVEAGMARQIDANEFRYAANRRLGWATLKSNLYTIGLRGDSLIFSGRGLGHGVGLCQAGAEQMGRMGYSTQQILAYYFPGTRVAPLSTNEADPIASSEHFEIVFPATQQEWVQQTLETLERTRRELGARADVISGRVRVRTWDTTLEFLRATGQPGWAAATNDGASIALQPLSLLKRKGILETTLRHELTHLVVHRSRASSVPHWYEEGLVLYLTREHIEPLRNELSLGRNLEEAISKPRSEAEMKAAYALALERVQKIKAERGEEALWRILQDPSAKDLHRLVE